MQCTEIQLVSSGWLTHWKMLIVICEVNCASLHTNSSLDCICLKFCLEDVREHKIVLQRPNSKIYKLNQKCILNGSHNCTNPKVKINTVGMIKQIGNKTTVQFIWEYILWHWTIIVIKYTLLKVTSLIVDIMIHVLKPKMSKKKISFETVFCS